MDEAATHVFTDREREHVASTTTGISYTSGPTYHSVAGSGGLAAGNVGRHPLSDRSVPIAATSESAASPSARRRASTQGTQVTTAPPLWCTGQPMQRVSCAVLNFFKAQPLRFETQKAWIAFIFSLLTGPALDWATPLIRNQSPILNSTNTLMDQMESIFGVSPSWDGQAMRRWPSSLFGSVLWLGREVGQKHSFWPNFPKRSMTLFRMH